MRPGLLDNPIRDYAWGSRTALAALLGTPSPSPAPQAELWMGAHPAAPSTLWQDSERVSLPAFIAAAPSSALGVEVVGRMGTELPFLFKVLAVARPLSIQVHPDANQARAGFAAEEAAGIPRDAHARTYRDPYEKPELLVALSPFRALCGFRPASEAAALLGALDVLPQLRASLEHGSFRAALEHILTADLPTRARAVGAVVDACGEQLAARGPFAEDCRTALTLHERYPGDAGIVAALLLNPLTLAPGEAIFLPPRQLHCYLEGTALELMACSDNVIRGGLTPKHVDVPELLRIAQFTPRRPEVQAPLPLGPAESAYEAPTEAFALSRLRLGPSTAPRWTSSPLRSAEIVLVTEGRVSLGARGLPPLELPHGASAFVPARTGRYFIEGEGVVFRARAGI